MRRVFFRRRSRRQENGEGAIIPNNLLSGNSRDFAPRQSADFQVQQSMRGFNALTLMHRFGHLRQEHGEQSDRGQERADR
jgi:hypothetical protein